MVLVSDINDHSPVFVSPTSTAMISEGLPVGAVVLNFLATDEDFGTNGEIQYSIESEQQAALGTYG